MGYFAQLKKTQNKIKMQEMNYLNIWEETTAHKALELYLSDTH